jgi:argininosuccinate lyase
VRRGVPFRESHGIVASLVRSAVDQGKRLSELTDAEVAAVAPQIDGGLAEVLSEGAWLESKVSEGGTSLERVREQLGRARAALREAGA